MLLRSIGKSLRGKATPTQVFLATLLGSLLGFVPGFFLVGDLGGGFMQAPGLIVALIFLVLVLNANLALFGLTLALAKLLGTLLLPVSFGVGQWLLDGPTQGLFKTLINAPVFAWFGFEYYATTGGLVVGAVVGLVLGFLTVRLLRSFRRRMADLETGSERYQKWSKKGWVKFGSWLLLGKGKGKRTYEELAAEEKKGLPIRIPGVIAVAVLAVLLWFGHSWLSGPGLQRTLRTGLEYWNGATVDLDTASLDLAGGRAVLAGFGMTDIEDLTRNTFQARTLDLQLGTSALWSKRFVVDKVVSTEAASGAVRETPGEIIRPPETPPEPPAEKPGEWTLEGVVQEADKWKQRLQQVSRVMEYFAGGGGDVPSETEVEQQGEVLGLARVAALHLLDQAPRLLVREVQFDGVEAIGLAGDLLDIRASNLSSNPSLVDEPMTMSIRSRSGAFEVNFVTDPKNRSSANLSVNFRGLNVDEWVGAIKGQPLRGGTVDVSLGGDLDLSRPEGAWIDMPLVFHLNNSVLAIPGLSEAPVNDFTVPIGLRGFLASPALDLDDEALANALLAAGRTELAGQVRQRATDLLKGQVPEGMGGEVGDALGGLIDGTMTAEQLAAQARAKAEAEAQARLDAEKKKAESEAQKLLDEQKKKAEGMLRGILGGKKKKDGS